MEWLSHFSIRSRIFNDFYLKPHGIPVSPVHLPDVETKLEIEIERKGLGDRRAYYFKFIQHSLMFCFRAMKTL